MREARRWYVLIATALGAFVATVMGTSVNVAMPSLVVTFDTTFPVVQWVVLAYLLSTSALLPIIGRLADMLGKKAYSSPASAST
jgi:MFS family permease